MILNETLEEWKNETLEEWKNDPLSFRYEICYLNATKLGYLRKKRILSEQKGQTIQSIEFHNYKSQFKYSS
jgi:hypothetical protein